MMMSRGLENVRSFPYVTDTNSPPSFALLIIANVITLAQSLISDYFLFLQQILRCNLCASVNFYDLLHGGEQ